MEKKTRNILLIVVVFALAAAVTTIVIVKGNSNRRQEVASVDSIRQDTLTVDTAASESVIDTIEHATEPEGDAEPLVAVKDTEPEITSPEPVASDPVSQAIATGRPVLVDFGRGTCIPCKKMMPILAELKETYAGRVEVLVLDLDEYLELAKEAGIQMIPTQIFYDASGQEVNRHVGFMTREEIVDQLKSMGIE